MTTRIDRRLLVACILLAGCAAAPEPSASAPASAGASPTESAVGPAATPGLTAVALQNLIEPADLEAHLAALQEIADDPAGDGSRATGSVGFDRSVAYVTQALDQAGYAVERHDFPIGQATSANLLAERSGTGDGVVMLGAHLDSVPVGPGINDNATGVAALLVIAEQLVNLPPPTVTVRFAFWGAEEGGPLGSRAYLDTLDTEARARIRAYLNFDMLGSPNGVTFVYDEPGAAAGSSALTNVVADFFDRRGFPWDPIDLDGDSDHGPFIEAGIPTGGLFAGGIEPVTADQAARFGAVAGQPADPCSHRACDTIDNVDIARLGLMTDAIANALVLLAAGAAS